MEKIERWLSGEYSSYQSSKFVAQMVFVKLFFAMFVTTLFRILGTPVVPQREVGIPLLSPVTISLLLFLVLLEEFVFRLVPLTIALLVSKKIGHKLLVVGGFALASSIIFGYLHGDWHNIFVQGIGGFAFSIIFLKTGGWNSDPAGIAKGFTFALATHVIFNFIAFAMAYAAGMRTI